MLVNICRITMEEGVFYIQLTKGSMANNNCRQEQVNKNHITFFWRSQTCPQQKPYLLRRCPGQNTTFNH